MKHPGMWCKDYDQYKEEMAGWNKQPFSVEKKTAESEYAMYIKNRKEKEMATTFNIKKRESAPEFVFGSFGCKLEDLIYLQGTCYVVSHVLLQSQQTSFHL